MDKTILRYKYVPFTTGSLALLNDGTMKFTSPTEFNDPFDCMPDINVSKFVEHVSSRKDLLKKSGDNLGYSTAKRLANKSKMLKHFEKNISDALRALICGVSVDGQVGFLGSVFSGGGADPASVGERIPRGAPPGLRREMPGRRQRIRQASGAGQRRLG